MANLKNGAIREMVLDKCLSDKKRKYNTKDLMEACNRVLIQEGYEKVTSLNTIRNDMRSIEQRWFSYGGVIIEETSGRNKFYRYENPNFSIFKPELKQEDLNKLNQALLVLSRFKGLPQFDWIEELNARFKSIFMTPLNTKVIIGFDDNVDSDGKQYISILFDAIVEKVTLSISYKRFDSIEGKEHIIHPYYLKEYNNRWFLLALDESYSRITTFALDRIVSVSMLNKQYIDNKEIDFNDYFDEIIGVTLKPENKIRKIKLWVSSEQYPYIKTKPLHGSQKVIKRLSDGSKIVQIEVRENYELIQTILSFGEKVIVIEPNDIRERVRKRISLAQKNYGKIKDDIDI